MDRPYETFEFQHNGCKFVASLYYDCDAGPPWEECDGHGPVRYEKRNRQVTRAGERVIHEDRHGTYLYDWAAATKTARREGWDSPPYKVGTRGEQAARAVEADFQYLRGWLRDDWCYCGVAVQALDDNGDPVGKKYDHAVWRIESNSHDYWQEVARELADEILAGFTAENETRQDRLLAELCESRPDLLLPPDSATAVS